MNCATKIKSCGGFTLLELLITLLILSVLLGQSLPGFQQMLNAKKADLTMKKLAQSIQYARSSAIRTGKFVTLCRSNDGESCGGRWEDGLISFTDSNGDRNIDEEDELLRHTYFDNSEGSLSWRAFQNRQYLQFTQRGFTRYQNGNFTYCPQGDDPTLVRQLIINRTGRIRYARDSDGDGFREDSRGRKLSCS